MRIKRQRFIYSYPNDPSKGHLKHRLDTNYEIL